jgi:parallel beta-helix repeat protein
MRSERKIYETALIFTVIFAMMAFISIECTLASTIYVPDDYLTIQQAVNNATEGDVIRVRAGTYIENVNVNKPLTIRSENGYDSTIVRAEDQFEDVFEVTADYVNISGFTVNGLRRWGKAGISLKADYCNISNNHCSNNADGIFLSRSNRNRISNNKCSNNDAGIRLEYSNDNSVTNNTCSNNSVGGIHLEYSKDNKLKGNVMLENGIFIIRGSINDYTHEIDTSNTVNGEPVYYWKDVEGGRVPKGAGQVILVNCSNVIVENQDLNNVTTGIEIAFSSYITIKNNTCSNNLVCMSLHNSINNSVTNNTCSNNNECIYLQNSTNNSISSNICSNNDHKGICLWYSTNNRVMNNTCVNNKVGISLGYSNNNSITNNTCSNNSYGIYLWYSTNNSIANNACSNNDDGISLWYSNNNNLTDNVMVENGIVILGDSISDYKHEISTSNTVNGGPVYYWNDVDGGRVPEGAGQVILINCSNVIIENQNLNNASIGIKIAFSSHVTIKNNNCSNNRYDSIYLYNSNNNNIANNNCFNNEAGIFLWSSNNNSISSNNCFNNGDFGIFVWRSKNNSVTNNNCSNNSEDGIFIWNSKINRVANNNCSNNSDGGISLWQSNTNSISNNNCSNNENSISLGASNDNSVTNNNCSNDRNGIYLWNSKNNKLTGNIMLECGIVIEAYRLSFCTQEIGESNTVNGKPVYYWKDIEGGRIPDGAGQVILVNCKNIAVENQNLNNASMGIQIAFSSGISIKNNDCSNSKDNGIFLYRSNNNSISDNNCSNSRDDGIYLRDSSNNSISHNNCLSNKRSSIYLRDSNNNKLRGNAMLESGIVIRGDSISAYTHEIDETNTVNGKPVYYWKDVEGGRIPDGAGQVILVNCSNVIVENQNLNNASNGIEIVFSSYITTKNNDCSNSKADGIFLYNSNNNSISNNNCSSNNKYGIYLLYSDNNLVYLNNFIVNADTVCSHGSTNIWNATKEITYTYNETIYTNYIGNYWSDYRGKDTNKDGIGDTPYCIGEREKDNYPLMIPTIRWE